MYVFDIGRYISPIGAEASKCEPCRKRSPTRRVAMRTELWNGNRERWRNLWSTDPEQNIVLWAFTRFEHTRTKYEGRTQDPRFAHLAVHRLRTEAERDGLLAALRS
jgi:hypothetical protein